MSSRSGSSVSARAILATGAVGIGLAFLLTACGEKAQTPAAAEAKLQASAEPQGSAEPQASAEPQTSVAEPQTPAAEPVTATAPDQAGDLTDPRPFQDLAAADILNLNQRWTGDYDQLAERRFLRVLVPFSRTLYYLDGPEQKGIAYEALLKLESQLPRIGKSKVRPKIVIIPTTRDRLLPALAEGYGDVAIGAFTVADLHLKPSSSRLPRCRESRKSSSRARTRPP